MGLPPSYIQHVKELTELSLLGTPCASWVSAEKVVATIEIPSNHQGMFLPERKNSLELDPAFRETIKPIARKATKNKMIITQSREDRLII